jgi:four helix bundle protein
MGAEGIEQRAWGMENNYSLIKEHSILTKFRFQDLEIWKLSIDITDELFDIADSLEGKKLYRFAEQLRGAVLSISNNIVEGSGSSSNRDFINFLNIAHRSAFETVNILIILNRRNIIDKSQMDTLLAHIDTLCRKITNFRKSLSI